MEFSDVQARLMDNMSSYSYASNSSTFVNQQMQITTLVMGNLNKSYLLKLLMNILTYLLHILARIFILSAVVHYLGPDLGDTYSLLEALSLIGHIGISKTFASVASRNIERYQSLQQINPCNYVFTYGIVMQIIMSLVFGLVLAFTIPYFINCEKITNSYVLIKFIVQPITYSIGPAFMRFLDTDGSWLFQLYNIKPVFVLLCVHLFFLISSVIGDTQPIMVVIAELIPEFIFAIVTMCMVIRKNSFTSLKFDIKFFKQFNPAIIARLFKQSCLQYFYTVEDTLIYFPMMYLITINKYTNQSQTRIQYFMYLTQLSQVVYDASISLTRTYSRINNQVQRYDRIYLMLDKTFKYIFLAQGIFAVLIFLISDYIMDFMNYQEEVQESVLVITKYGAIKGFICAFGTATTILQVDIIWQRIQFFVFMKTCHTAFQIILAVFQPKSRDLLSCCLMCELFSSSIDALIYPIVLRIFKVHRENTVYNVVDNKSDATPLKESKSSRHKSKSKSTTFDDMSDQVSNEAEMLQPEPEQSKMDRNRSTTQFHFEEIDECYFEPETFQEFMQDSNPDPEEVFEDFQVNKCVTIEENEEENQQQLPANSNFIKNEEGMQLVINNVAERQEDIE